MVGELQGKNKKESIIMVDDNIIEDDQVKANLIADFFESKILNLTLNIPPICKLQREELKMQHLTISELESSLKHIKTKMSSGSDGIPMWLVKFYTQKRPLVVLEIFNEILDKGFPEIWKTARVPPISKKGDLSKVENYRPVSNLSSLSKLFERCILHRLMSLPNYS